jgi:predicted GNAT family N-acyltransferase
MSAHRRFRIEQASWATAQDELRAIRFEVFVQEQSVPEALEWDGLDSTCQHVLARDANGAAIATGRLLPDGHIGRMAVLAQWRRHGVGTAVLVELLRIAKNRGDAVVVLHAQSYVTQFYARLGFVVTSPEFMEAGIPHVEMTLPMAPR